MYIIPVTPSNLHLISDLKAREIPIPENTEDIFFVHPGDGVTPQSFITRKELIEDYMDPSMMVTKLLYFPK